MNSLEEAKEYLESIQDDLAFFPTKREMLDAMISYGEGLDIPEENKIEQNKVPGCVSNVYIIAEIKDNRVFYKGTSDSLITKGYVGILTKALSGLNVEDVHKADPIISAFVEKTGINASMVASRANAFGNIFVFMKKKALL